MNKIKFYYLDRSFVEILHYNCDNKIPIKSKRPFIGILIEEDEFTYFQPLTTVKPKHRKMQNNLDFNKLLLPNGSFVGVININNIIPIKDLSVVEEIIFKSLPTSTLKDQIYKNIIIQQYNAFVHNKEMHLSYIKTFIKRYKEKSLPQKILDRTVDFDRVKSYQLK